MGSSLDAVAQSFCANPHYPQNVRALAALGTPRSYRSNARLLNETDRGDTLFVVMEGEVRAFGHDPQEREITFGHVGPGDYFGEMALDGGPRSANVEAVAPTVCALVSRDALLAFIGRQPSFALDLLAKVTRRARMATNSARNLAFIDVYSRLARVLASAAEPQSDGSAVLPDSLSLADLAQRVGCSRDMLGRILKDLQSAGFLDRPDGRVVLRSPLPQRW
jgi:CRP/FNR family cyclic AMP-dependent transcriptional regulator